jgi:hypothetical protein
MARAILMKRKSPPGRRPKLASRVARRPVGDRARGDRAAREPTLYTRAEALARLRAHAARGASPSSRWLARHDRTTYRSLLAHFDTISAARAAARVAEPARERKWSQVRVIETLRRLGRRRRLRITAKGLVNAGYSGLLTAAAKYVGSLPRARKLAGIPAPPAASWKVERWNDDRVIHEIRARRRANRSLAVTKAPGKLVWAAIQHCGSWREAIEMAGLDYSAVRLRRAPWRKEEVLDALRATVKRAGGAPARLSRLLSKQALRWFGDLRTAAVAAGVDPGAFATRPRLTTREVEAQLRRLARKRPTMTVAELRRTKLGTAAERRYGGLVGVLKRLGLEGWPRRLLTPLPSREGLLRQLHARRRRGESLIQRDVITSEGRLLRAAIKHFGSWPAAMQAAGLRVVLGRQPWDRARVLREIRSRHQARRPLAASKVPNSLYLAASKHYGGWKQALDEAGLDHDAIRLTRAPWSRDEVLAAIRATARSGRTGIGPDGYVSPRVVEPARRWFGSVRAAIVAAGGDPTRVRRPVRRTDAQIAAALRKLARDKPAMKLTELRKSTLGLTAASRYGTLAAALKLARIKNWPQRVRWPLPSREEVLRAIRLRHARGESLYQLAVLASEPRLLKAASKHFGTWRGAMTAAGLGSLVGVRRRRP